MNQILSTNDENGKSVMGLKPVIRFFSISIIVFAVIVSISAGVALYKSRKAQSNFPRAELSVEKKGSTLKLTITDEIAISKIEYSWNDGNITVLKNIGNEKVDLSIEIPQGENYLNVTVTDVNKNKTKFDSYKVEFSEDEDAVKPTIDIARSTTTGKLEITVKDDRELKQVSYYWEGDEPKVVTPDESDKTTVKIELDVAKGTKTVYVDAEDASGNLKNEYLKVTGSNGVKISVSVKDNNFVVKLTSDNVITKATYTHNEKEHKVTDIPKNAKQFEFKVPLEDGTNYLKINAFENDLMTEYKCKKTK